MPWFFFQFFLCFFFDALCDRPYLRGGIPLADHKEITYCIANVAKVNDGNVFSFFISYGLDNNFYFRGKSGFNPWLLFLYF